MDWNDFVQRLAAELVRLSVDAYVIVQGPGGFPYVQAMRYPNVLAGEAVSDAFLGAPQRLDLSRIQRMISLGWREPDGQNRVNWWNDIALPADMGQAGPQQLAECDHLAVRMVAALRDIYGVPSPNDLEYRANQNGPGGGPLALPGLGLKSADQQQPLAAPPPERGQSWAEFGERLAAELAGLDDGMVLVVHRADQDAYYVQAHRDPTRVRAEAAANDVLDEPLRFSAADEKRLADAGWGAPDPKWWVELPTSAPATAFRGLAEMMVTALRDVQKAREPADLRYDAFRGDTGIELTDFGIAPADPNSVSERRPATPIPTDSSPSTPDAPAVEPDVGVEEGLEDGLVAAKQRGDQRAYLALIKEAGLIVPATGRSGVVEFATTSLNDGLYVLTFTSAELMAQVLGGQAEHFRHVTVDRLAAEWPNPVWKLSINLGLPSEAYFDASVVAELGQTAVGAEADATESAEAGRAVMQKVVPHPLVVHYLEGGYDRVAGYVHRVEDAAELTTPELLVRGLGLTYEDSPFSADDDAVHVIRWPVYQPALFKTPYGGVDEESMRAEPDGWVIERPPFLGTGYAPGDGPPIAEFKIVSQRLPHGAEMYRVERSGEVIRVATFDADAGQWVSEHA